MKKILLLCFLFLNLGASAQTVSAIDVAGLKANINSLQGFTRIIFIGDPTCPGCIASANDLRNFIFNICDNPDLRGLIVWIHKNGFNSTMSNAVSQSSLWSDARISFYWDSIATDVGYAFGYLGGWSGCTYAWDISMIYPAGVTWTGTYPPAPYYCISKTGCCNPYNIISERGQLNALGACYDATGVDENISSLSAITVFPNPVSSQLNISCKNFSHAELFSVDGRKVLETQKSTTNISSIAAGIYFLKVISGKDAFVRKIIKL